MPPKLNRYREFDPSICTNERAWPSNCWTVASFDPSPTEHFAVRITKRYFTGTSKTKLVKLMKAGEHWKRSQRKKDYQVEMFNGLTSELELIAEDLLTCHILIIEEQREEAYENILIAQHCISFLLLLLRDSPLRPLIYSVESRLKTDMFKGTEWEKAREEKNKAWAERVGQQILEQRGDWKGLEFIQTYRRKHDLFDTVCQEEALFLHLAEIGKI